MAEIRDIPIVKTILLSIVTLGIYYLIWFYRNTHDIQESRPSPMGAWKLLFWLGFLTFGITWIVLVIFNFLGLQEIRHAQGKTDDAIGILALVLYFVTGIVGPILWAVWVNDTA